MKKGLTNWFFNGIIAERSEERGKSDGSQEKRLKRSKKVLDKRMKMC